MNGEEPLRIQSPSVVGRCSDRPRRYWRSSAAVGTYADSAGRVGSGHAATSVRCLFSFRYTASAASIISTRLGSSLENGRPRLTPLKNSSYLLPPLYMTSENTVHEYKKAVGFSRRGCAPTGCTARRADAVPIKRNPTS